MVTKILLFQVITALASATELLPERYLKPQDFNHHPFTDVGIPAALKKALTSNNPYAILSKKRLREGREFPPQNSLIYPTPHPSVISRKYIETNEISKYDEPYVNVPKNYAFSYIVKDQHSGDDFSHSQAHNGKATRGQYRVKLPDGRTQIVSYTADHKGYRADVQYEEDLIAKPKALYHSIPDVSANHQNYQVAYVPAHVAPVNSKPQPQVVYTVTASPSSYHPSSTTGSPVQYVTESTPLNLVVKTSTAPHYYQPHYVTTTAAPYVQQQYVTSTASPYVQQQYVSSTAAPYVQQQYVTSTAAPHYQSHVSSTPLYPVPVDNTAQGGYQQEQYQNYQAVSSTSAPEHAVIVTPRPAYNRAIRKNEPHSPPLYYRLL